MPERDNTQQMEEDIQKLVQIADAMIIKAALNRHVEIPDVLKIYEESKLLVNNKQTLGLLNYIEFLISMVRGFILQSITQQMQPGIKNAGGNNSDELDVKSN